MSDVLTLVQLSAGYSRSPVIRNVNLRVKAGEIVALLGANGAGKTTTLRAVSGLVDVTQGSVLYNGEDLRGLSAEKRARSGIAHVVEGRGVFFGLTVAEHFRLSPPGARLDPSIAYTFFPELARIQGRRAGSLSGGEQQMLAVGRAMSRRPKLLLLDELSLGLAPVIVERLLPAVRSFSVATQAAVLMVEQHVRLALAVSDKGYVLSHGDVVLEGSAAELNTSASVLTASYLGDAAVDTTD